jgi:hypothetical protein
MTKSLSKDAFKISRKDVMGFRNRLKDESISDLDK